MLPTAAGRLEVACASGAALDHADPRVRAGYNLYELDDAGAIVSVEARVLDASGAMLQRASIAEPSRCA